MLAVGMCQAYNKHYAPTDILIVIQEAGRHYAQRLRKIARMPVDEMGLPDRGRVES